MSDSPTEVVLEPDDRLFRDVLGQFATGVTIITATFDHEPIGLAANSFTSLSLDPPMVLFCVAHSSTTWPRIRKGRLFAVNVLGEDHEGLCRKFIARDTDRFSTLSWSEGISGSPVLDDAIAYLDCEIAAEYPGGDHTIVVGRVLDLGLRGGRPLLYFGGAYGRLLGD